MKVLAGYLLRTVLAATGLTMLVLLALAGFIEFIGQLDNTGEGTYETAGAALYTLLRLPLLAVEMLPVAALLGGLLGLGSLAGNSELIAMRAAGISARRLAAAVAVSGVLLAVAGVVVGEYIAPPLDQFARKYRSAARSETAMAGQRDTWVRDGRRIYNVEGLNDRLQFGGFFVFEINDDDTLALVGRASSADLVNGNDWSLENYRQTRFDATPTGRAQISADWQPRTVERFNVDAELLGIAALRPGSLSIRGLRSYLGYLRQNKLEARAYETEFWSRVANSAAVVLMPMLAIGFVFGSLRSTGAGARLLVGVLIGLGYFLASRTLANSGEVFSIDPLLVGIAPTAALALATAIAIQRIR